MAERRARDLELGEFIRPIDADEPYAEIVFVESNGDDVLIDVQDSDGVRPRSLPVLDGDDVLDVKV